MRILGYDFVAHHRRCDSKPDVQKRCGDCEGLDETPSPVGGNDRHCVALAYTKGARYLPFCLLSMDKRPKSSSKTGFRQSCSALGSSQIRGLEDVRLSLVCLRFRLGALAPKQLRLMAEAIQIRSLIPQSANRDTL